MLGGAVLAAALPGRVARAQPGLLDFDAAPTALLGNRCNYPRYAFPSDPQYGSIAGQLTVTYLWRAGLGLTDPPGSAGCADVRVDRTGFYSGVAGMAYTLDTPATTVPEPTTAVLVAAGALAVGVAARRWGARA